MSSIFSIHFCKKSGFFLVKLTKEAVDDSKEATHGADHGGHYLISPLDLLVTLQPHLSQTQQLAGGGHGDRSGGGAESDERRGQARRGSVWISGSAGLTHGDASACKQEKKTDEEDSSEVRKETEWLLIALCEYSAVSADGAISVVTRHSQVLMQTKSDAATLTHSNLEKQGCHK